MSTAKKSSRNSSKSASALKIVDSIEGAEHLLAATDPQFPYYPVTIGDQVYKLCFDYDQLAKAEYEIMKEGWRVNLLYALDVRTLNLDKVRAVFGAAVRTFHPGLRYEDAAKLVDLGSLFQVATAILTAFADYKEASSPALTKVKGTEAAAAATA